MQKLREEDGVELEDDDDEAMWQGWDVESDSGSDSDAEDWINVDDNNNDDLVISDSEDEGKPKVKSAEVSQEDTASIPRLSTLATTKVSCIVIQFGSLTLQSYLSRFLHRPTLPFSTICA